MIITKQSLLHEACVAGGAFVASHIGVPAADILGLGLFSIFAFPVISQSEEIDFFAVHQETVIHDVD